MNKQFWIDLAVVIDALRIIPRLMLVAVSSFALWYVYYVSHFYFSNLSILADSNSAIYGASGVIGITVPAVVKLSMDYIHKYLETGRKWSEKKEQTEDNV